jgi:RyR domain
MRLARTIHEAYLAQRTREGVSMGATPAMLPWDTLDDDLRLSNLDQARDVLAKIAKVGAVVCSGPDPAGFAFTDEEVERLSRLEHVRWARQRRANGWLYGPIRDDARKYHPDLIPWPQLSEEARDKDREVVRNVPALLAAAGLHAVRS